MPFSTKDEALQFMLAGNATFTLTSAATGSRFTFKVTRKEDGKPWSVRLLTGPDNDADYSYIGCLIWDKAKYAHPRFLPRKRKEGEEVPAEPPPSERAIDWFVGKALRSDDTFKRVTVHHAGRCGRCGRTLTVPESIETGFGPECANKV